MAGGASLEVRLERLSRHRPRQLLTARLGHGRSWEHFNAADVDFDPWARRLC
jgi:hypothetical protein